MFTQKVASKEDVPFMKAASKEDSAFHQTSMEHPNSGAPKAARNILSSLIAS